VRLETKKSQEEFMRSNVKIFFFTLLILFLSFLVPSAQQNSPKSKISSESDSLITARPTGLKTEENPPITVTRPSIREDSIPLPIIKAALDRKEIPLDKERFRSFLDSIRVRKDSESAEPPPVEQGTYQIPTAVFESRIPECKIFLKAREFAPVIGLSQVLASQPKAGRTHLMIQFYDIPSDADIRTMESHGVILLDYIPNYTYYASVPAADSELLSLPMVRSVCEIESNDKISPNIRDYGIGDWARDTNGNVKLNVIFFGDVSKLVALSVAERYGRVISSSDIGNLFVISIPETSIGDLVNESDVQWVEQVAAGNMELLDQVRGATGAETVQAAPGDEALDDPTPCLTYKEIYSTVPGNKYWEMAGTSMAAPVVSGALGLMKQQFNKLGYGEIKPHTFKAILVQSADDVGNPGSGYSYGHGNLNLKTAIDLIINNYPKNDLIRVGTVADDETDNYYMNVPSGVNKLRVTLVWDDIEGTPAAAKELVNDLDLLLTDPNGVNHYAYRLDKDNPGANATKGFNSLDNVEVVEVDNPVAGHWTIRVWGWIVTGTEEYTVVAPYEDVKCGDYLYQNTELTYDLDCDSSQDGLNLNADNITLDCKGHKIRGNYNGSYWSLDYEQQRKYNTQLRDY
ncbi:MAG: S8 family serine peptidase, partial [candidate division Zixibacteria bacterium]|nr:S8 family serine peptidase [candidate division Zixibacteria bacterium]